MLLNKEVLDYDRFYIALKSTTLFSDELPL
jgi:hypothetical protein